MSSSTTTTIATSTNGLLKPRPRPRVVAVEEDEDVLEDLIPGPPSRYPPENGVKKVSSFAKLLQLGQNLGTSQTGPAGSSRDANTNSGRLSTRIQQESASQHANQDEIMDLSTSQMTFRGNGILASRADLSLSPEEFAAGCKLLQAAAAGNMQQVQALLQERPTHVNFRDYDRRTALHVAASEGHLEICKYLVKGKKVKINRSDRWGGSPLDDAHRHRHLEVAQFLRQAGGVTGSGNQSTNLITAAASGDFDEVQMLLSAGGKAIASIVNKGDYDKRTPLHLAASEGHVEIVLLLCKSNADVNAEDRWGSRPLDDAIKSEQQECIQVLKTFGAKESANMIASQDIDQSQSRREKENLKVDFEELHMVDKIGSGAFGE